MNRHILAGLSILAVATGVGWTLASHSETATGLQEVSLNVHSEHAQPGPDSALAGVRVRLSPSDLGYELRAADHQVPQITVVAE